MADPAKPRSRRRRALVRTSKIALGIATAVLGFVGLRHIDLSLAVAQMAALPHTTLLLVLGISVAQAFVLATRLWAVFPSGKRPRWAHVARGYSFGQFANSCLPARAGDVLKVMTIADRGDTKGDAEGASGDADADAKSAEGRASAADATGVVLADKALDVVTLGGMVMVFAPALLLGAVAGMMHAAWIGVAASMLAIGGVHALRRFWPAAFARVRRGVGATFKTLRRLLTPRRLITGLGLGCGAWLAEAISMLFLSAPLGVHLSLGQAMVTLLVLNLGIALPVSVANVGAYEAAMVVGLAPFGVALPQAIAIGVIHHVMQIITVVLCALGFWLRDRIGARMRGLRRAAPVAPEAATQAAPMPTPS